MKKIVIAVIAVLSVCIFSAESFAGTGYFNRSASRGKLTRTYKSSALNKAEKAFIEGEYGEVVNICNDYSVEGDRVNDELQYIAGRALLKLGRFDEARNRFSKVVNYSKSDALLDESYIGLADSYYLENNYEKAKEYYEKVLRYFPDADDIPIVYYRLGECCVQSGKKSEADEYSDKLLRLYPDSLEAKLLAAEKSAFVTYSVQVGSFGKWNNAKKLHDELKTQGFDVNIHTTVMGPSRFYRVRVGQYGSLNDAEDMARGLRNKGYSVKIYP
ncbi:MAG: tetratricopeptide repeat protein [Candidatus Omnitrophica bacterium]|nr:tetratricopeptide repeat protein [Candidatus Omnitrophota bacterium]